MRIVPKRMASQATAPRMTSHYPIVPPWTVPMRIVPKRMAPQPVVPQVVVPKMISLKVTFPSRSRLRRWLAR
jgi:hypothetical protein